MVALDSLWSPAAGDPGRASTPTVSVIGTGYLGLTHAVCMAELGMRVLATDTDLAKLRRLSVGDASIYEPGLDRLLAEHLGSGRLRFTSDVGEIGEECDVHFLCVGTPQMAGGLAADTTQLERALAALVPAIRRDCLIVGKSTVPVGTAERLAASLPPGTGAGPRIGIAWNPEFLREGFAVADSLSPDRLVFGVADGWSEAVLRSTYRPLIEAGTPVVVTDLATAQLIKVAANAFLATKISYINAMAEICEAAGANVADLAGALGLDRRIAPAFLRPGLGFGGGCLAKDIRAFRQRSAELGAGEAVSFLGDVERINSRRRARAVFLAEAMLGTLPGRPVTALGAAFKPDSDDVRDSPALDVAARLHSRGALVRVYDPAATGSARLVRPELTYCDSLDEAVRGSELLLVLTEWDEFRRLDPHRLRGQVSRPRVLDCRFALDPLAWRAAGWHYQALGLPLEEPGESPATRSSGERTLERDARLLTA